VKAYQNFIEGVVNERYPLENLVVPVCKLLAELDLDNNEQLLEGCAKCFTNILVDVGSCRGERS